MDSPLDHGGNEHIPSPFEKDLLGVPPAWVVSGANAVVTQHKRFPVGQGLKGEDRERRKAAPVGANSNQ